MTDAPSLSDAQLRLLRAVAERMPLALVRELYLFAPMRQGGTETGLAVIAAAVEPDPVDAQVVLELGDAVVANLDDAFDAPGADERQSAPAAATDSEADAVVASPVEPPRDGAPPRALRYTVYTARYRLQLKGPDRGNWEVEVVEEADAPLLSVDAVVRGVQRRVGDVNEVEQLSGAELVALLAAAG